MTRRCLAALLLAGFVTTAAAQTVALDAFLEQRAAEELAADGMILSRLGVALDIEIVGDKTLVSLVDPATRRTVASTKIDKLPADREAAVATVTQVVANLASQLASNNTTANATATAMKTVLDEERKQREQKEAADAAYRREEIHFGDIAMISSDGTRTTTTVATIPYRGDRRLSVPEFFEAVDRPDLSTRFYRRRNFGIGAVLVGTAASLGGTVLLLKKGIPNHQYGTCNYSDPGYEACLADEDLRNDARDRDASKWLKIGIGVSLGGLVVSLVGYYYVFRANPINEHEAHDIADGHNAKLRIKHGLPALSQKPERRFEEVALVPYADVGGGGLTLTGRF